MHGGVEYQALGDDHGVLQRRRRATRSSARSESDSRTEPSLFGRRVHAAEQVGGRWLSVCVLMVLMSAATASPARAQGSTDPNPGALTFTGGFDFVERVSVPRHPAGRHRRHHVALRRPGLRAALGRRGPQERQREHRDVEQSPHGRCGQQTVRAASCGTSRTSTRASSFGFGEGTTRRRDLHGVHEPERHVRDREGAVVQVRRRRQRPARSGGSQAVRRCSRRSSMGRRMAAPTRARISSSGSRPGYSLSKVERDGAGARSA